MDAPSVGALLRPPWPPPRLFFDGDGFTEDVKLEKNVGLMQMVLTFAQTKTHSQGIFLNAVLHMKCWKRSA